jgi:hypothetical protein
MVQLMGITYQKEVAKALVLVSCRKINASNREALGPVVDGVLSIRSMTAVYSPEASAAPSPRTSRPSTER